MYEYLMPPAGDQFLGGPSQAVFPQLTPQQAQQLGNVDVKQALDYVIYDTKYFVAGTAVPTSPINFFAVQNGAQDSLANNNAVTFTKNAAMTNVVQPSQLERGQMFVCRTIEAIVTVPGNFDLTVQSSGNTTLPSTLPASNVSTTATAGVLATNLENAILKMGLITLKVGNNLFESGPLIQFPSQFGISGYAGGVFSGTAQAGVIVPNEAVANNGFGRPRVLRYPRTILAGQNFGIRLEFPVAFTPSRNCEIQLCLRGELYRDIS